MNEKKRKTFAVKYLKSLLYSVENDDLEIEQFEVTKGEPEIDSNPYEIKIEMIVVGFSHPLYSFLTDE